MVSQTRFTGYPQSRTRGHEEERRRRPTDDWSATSERASEPRAGGLPIVDNVAMERQRCARTNLDVPLKGMIETNVVYQTILIAKCKRASERARSARRATVERASAGEKVRDGERGGWSDGSVFVARPNDDTSSETNRRDISRAGKEPEKTHVKARGVQSTW